jgi:hypothetical protein
MLTELAVFHDHCRAEDGGVELVVAHAAPPGIEDQGIARRVTALGNANQFPNVLDKWEGDGTFLLSSCIKYRLRDFRLSRRPSYDPAQIAHRLA